MNVRGSHVLQTQNISDVATRRGPPKIRTYSNQNNFDVGYLLTDTDRTIILIVSCSIGGIIIISGKNLYEYSYLILMILRDFESEIGKTNLLQMGIVNIALKTTKSF